VEKNPEEEEEEVVDKNLEEEVADKNLEQEEVKVVVEKNLEGGRKSYGEQSEQVQFNS
jgi:hypothetical protein